MTEAIKVEGLQKTFQGGVFEPDRTVLRSFQFSVPLGQTAGFIGVNGSGKTTTLKCILGFIRPNAGKISFFGGEPLSNAVKSRLGYLPERPYYHDFLTAEEYLRFHWDLSGGGEGFPAASNEVLDKVKMTPHKDRRLRGFSKGMLQRIGLAQALLRRPELLILDEPMSGLDPDGRILIKDIIRSEQQKGTTIFFSSHLLGDMDELCQHLVVLDQGQLMFQGALKDFAQKGNVEDTFREMRKHFVGVE